VFESRVLLTPLPAVGRPTLYTRVGDWPGVLATVLSLVLAAWPWLRRARQL
jgi:apolipoprotein N-acyltransferase